MILGMQAHCIPHTPQFWSPDSRIKHPCSTRCLALPAPKDGHYRTLSIRFDSSDRGCYYRMNYSSFVIFWQNDGNGTNWRLGTCWSYGIRRCDTHVKGKRCQLNAGISSFCGSSDFIYPSRSITDDWSSFWMSVVLFCYQGCRLP
jgi:hypothetical protein